MCETNHDDTILHMLPICLMENVVLLFDEWCAKLPLEVHDYYCNLDFIFKCLQCEFAFHLKCSSFLS
ncbi:hypothetical protein HanRHA438_Chr12g0535701 [Helianthus annuus]|nr:hypothetical protein HanRHA438_Chr12g0535701 [Helianthus annuus]